MSKRVLCILVGVVVQLARATSSCGPVLSRRSYPGVLGHGSWSCWANRLTPRPVRPAVHSEAVGYFEAFRSLILYAVGNCCPRLYLVGLDGAVIVPVPQRISIMTSVACPDVRAGLLESSSGVGRLRLR